MRLATGNSPRDATVLERAVAYLADAVLTALAWALLVLALTGGSLDRLTTQPARGVVAGFLFLLLPFLYFLAAEWIMATTPGKRLVGLRVKSLEHEQPSLFAVTVRNVLRLAWALGPLGPLLLAVDAAFVHLGERGQRVGDLAAGTRIVREGPAVLRL